MGEKKETRTARFNRLKTKQYCLRLNKTRDDDQKMIAWLDSLPNKTAALREIVLREIGSQKS